MSTALRFGFIGCGEAAGCHAQVVQALGHRIAAAAARPGSPRLESFSRRFGVEQVYTDWRRMLKQPLDALVVAVSWDQTEQIAAEVLSFGMPVLFEKPLALSTQAALKVRGAVRGRMDSVLIGYNRRFYDFMPWLRSAIDEQAPLSLQLQCPDSLKGAASGGRSVRDFALLYKTSHWLDLAMYLLGPLKLKHAIRRDEPAPAFHALLLSGQGVPVHLSADFDTPANVAVTAAFAGRICRLSPVERLQVYEGMEVVQEGALRRYRPQLCREQQTDMQYKPGFLNQMRYFIDVCVRQSAAAAQGCHLEDACRLTLLCESIDAAPALEPAGAWR